MKVKASKIAGSGEEWRGGGRNSGRTDCKDSKAQRTGRSVPGKGDVLNGAEYPDLPFSLQIRLTLRLATPPLPGHCL